MDTDEDPLVELLGPLGLASNKLRNGRWAAKSPGQNKRKDETRK